MRNVESSDTDTLSPEPINFKREFFKFEGKIYRIDNSHNQISMRPATIVESVVYENMPVVLKFELTDWVILAGISFPFIVTAVLFVRWFLREMTP